MSGNSLASWTYVSPDGMHASKLMEVADVIASQHEFTRGANRSTSPMRAG